MDQFNHLARSFGFTFLLIFCVSLSFGQHTRKYFQQTVNYTIQVQLDDERHFLHGLEEIEYINNSHHGIDTIWFHLWPNAYQSNETALGKQLLENGEVDFYYYADEDRGYIDSLDFSVDGQKIQWEYHKEHSDICALILPKKLAPGDRIEITTPFRVKIPKAGVSRLGHDGQSYQITQWYPKPAVFDRNGWHPMPYLNQGEFYSEFGTFDVFITLPQNYLVAATGDLQTASEVAYLNDRIQATKEGSYSLKDVESSKTLKTIHYRQSNVHDFAWFTDKNYLVSSSEVTLPHGGNKVKTYAFYYDRTKHEWGKVPQYINQALHHYSKYNGDYPYNQCSAVEGSLSAGGGMEYPNVTIIDYGMEGKLLETVIVHEVGHNWFYGILGFNERAYPSMDEGINSFYEMKYLEEYKGDTSLSAVIGQVPQIAKNWLNLDLVTPRGEKYHTYLYSARNNTDQHLMCSAHDYTLLNYGSIVYAKMAVSLQMLRAYIGAADFDRAMQRFFQEWKFKHPGPKDFQAIIESETKKDVRWFFGQYLHSTGKVDVKVKGVKSKGDHFELTLKNKAQIDVPFTVYGMSKEGKIITTKSVGLFSGKDKVKIPMGDVHHFKVDTKLDLVERNRRNNTIRTKGLLRKVEPLQVKFGTSLEHPGKTQLFLSPLIGWNSGDQTMLGLALLNKSFIEKPFEYYLGPMYSFHRKQLNGILDLEYHWYFKKFLKRLSINGNYMRFSYNHPFYNAATTFSRYYPKVRLDFKKKQARSPWSSTVILGTLYIEEETNRENLPFVSEQNVYGMLTYELKQKKTLTETDLQLKNTLFEQFNLVELDAKKWWRYNHRGSRISIRGYGGYFLTNTATSPRYNLRLDGQRGWYDYSFSHVFLERGGTHDLWAQQMQVNQGGFKTPTGVGQSNQWMAAASLKVDLPIRFPLSGYLDVGSSGSTNEVFYNSGVVLRIIRDAFEVYFPIVWSDSIEKSYIANDISYNEQIRFTLNLTRINPYRSIERIIQ